MKNYTLLSAFILLYCSIYANNYSNTLAGRSMNNLGLSSPKLKYESFESHGQEEITISGVITDEYAVPIPGANIFIEGTSIGTVSDFDGKFSLKIPSNIKMFSVTYIGYKRQELSVDNKQTFKIILEEDASKLEEVVVVGYGTESRKNITASISSIEPESIKSLPKSSATEMLEGRLPGVQVMTENSPGGGNSIRIRGFSTINNNDPLVIIDGVPSSNGLNSINPQDIESLQVLKDAASSSIYGSRAANGVVVVTTKKGTKKEMFETQLDIYSGIQTAYNLPEMLNAQEYGDLLWQATINDGKIPANDVYGNNPNQAVIPEWLNAEQTIPSADTKWIEEIMRPAVVQSYNLRISKGNEKGQQTFSLGYFDQEGVIKHTDFKRYSARFNSDYNIGKFLTIGENFTALYSERTSVTTNSALGSVVHEALQYPSIIPVKDINGDFSGNPLNDTQNPLGKLYRNKDNVQKTIQALGNVYASIKLSDFTFKTSLGIDYQNYNFRDFSPVYSEILTQNPVNSLSTSNNFNYQITWSNTLNYKKSFNNIHNLDVLIGQEAIQYYYEGFSASRQNFLYEDTSFQFLNFGAENQLNTGIANEWSLNSYFGRVNYNFDQKYLLSATIRRDGTSRLAYNNWGTFPAASVGWRVDRENFFDLGDTFNSFLIRASWGQTGNQQVPAYSTVDSYSNNVNYSNYAINGGQSTVQTGLSQTRVSNPNLEWETSTQTTIGVDLGFFSSKLNVTAEVFNKKTENILIYNPIPLTYGGTNDGQWINDGEMKNTGFELDINYSSKSNNNFNYSLALNLTHYKNELTTLNTVPYLGLSSGALHVANFDQEVSRSAVGQPIGAFFGYQANGIFKSTEEINEHGMQPEAVPGDIRFVDVNGDNVIDENDRTFIGSPHPSVMLGFNVNLKYKRIDLGMFFNGNFGSDMYNLTKFKTHFFNQSAYNKHSDLLNAWTPDNPNATVARLSLDDANNNIRPSSYYIEDGSYFKLNNLQLGYTFDNAILGGAQLRIYGQANNVFTITDYSGMTPEIGLQNYSSSDKNLDIGVDRGVYPPSRTYTLGLNLTF